jgi:hypothetical protein
MRVQRFIAKACVGFVVLTTLSSIAAMPAFGAGVISFTSATSAAFTVGHHAVFTVSASSSSADTVDFQLNDMLPDGLSFSDNGDGTATIDGTPASDAATTTVHVDAFDSDDPDATQALTITILAAPVFTSATSAYFAVNQFKSFTVDATASPKATFSIDPAGGQFPTGISLSDNGDGTATISGSSIGNAAPGAYPVTIDAQNGVGATVQQSFTLYLTQAPTITNASDATFTVGVAGRFALSATGYPASTWRQANGTIPAGLLVDPSGAITGTPTASGNGYTAGGVFPVEVVANNDPPGTANADVDNVSQIIDITVDEAPSFTSATAFQFPDGVSNAFAVTTSGYPLASITESGPLPDGVTFSDNGDGTATILGTPSTPGSYPITLAATNGIGADATQHFTLVVPGAATFMSAASATMVTGIAASFTVVTTSQPTAVLSESGALPSGVTFVDNGDGTATISGTPAAGTGGSYPLTLSADYGAAAPVTQRFSLTINQSPTIDSTPTATFAVGSLASFTIGATGFPTPTFSEAGNLPDGVTFNNATGILSGTPVEGTGGTYVITFGANNNLGTQASQHFTLVVDEAPSFSSTPNVTFVSGTPGSFTVTAHGYPTPALTESGTLPNGVTFVDNGDGSASVSGRTSSDGSGAYALRLSADNGSGSATQSFTLAVDAAPSIKVSGVAEYANDAPVEVVVTGAGFPTPQISESGTLPSGVTFVNGALNGHSAAAGSYPLTFTASNGIGLDASADFTLVIDPNTVSEGGGGGGSAGPTGGSSGNTAGGGTSSEGGSAAGAGAGGTEGGGSVSPTTGSDASSAGESAVGAPVAAPSGAGDRAGADATSTVKTTLSKTATSTQEQRTSPSASAMFSSSGPTSASVTANLVFHFRFGAQAGKAAPTGKLTATIAGPPAIHSTGLTKPRQGKTAASTSRPLQTTHVLGSALLTPTTESIKKIAGKKIAVVHTRIAIATLVIKANALGLGSHTITFVYGGDAHHASATTRKTVFVVRS